MAELKAEVALFDFIQLHYGGQMPLTHVQYFQKAVPEAAAWDCLEDCQVRSFIKSCVLLKIIHKGGISGESVRVWQEGMADAQKALIDYIQEFHKGRMAIGCVGWFYARNPEVACTVKRLGIVKFCSASSQKQLQCVTDNGEQFVCVGVDTASANPGRDIDSSTGNIRNRVGIQKPGPDRSEEVLTAALSKTRAGELKRSWRREAAPSAAQTYLRSVPECVVCLDKDVSARLSPCHHSCLCMDDALALENAHGSCPLCREPITRVQRGVFHSLYTQI